MIMFFLCLMIIELSYYVSFNCDYSINSSVVNIWELDGWWCFIILKRCCDIKVMYDTISLSYESMLKI